MDTNLPFNIARTPPPEENSGERGAQLQPSYSAPDLSKLRLNYLGDPKFPMVLFFGPPSSGKTVCLLRLLKFFMKQGHYAIEINRNLRTDGQYAEVIVPEFEEALKNIDNLPVPPGNKGDNFIGIEVRDTRSQAGFNFIELPGEYLYDPKNNSHRTAPPYIVQIQRAQVRKLVYFLIPLINSHMGELTVEGQSYYFSYIQTLLSSIFDPREDQFTFMIPKADQYPGRLIVNANQIVEGGSYKALLELDSFKGVREFFVAHNLPMSALTFFSGIENGDYFEWSRDYWPQLLWVDIQNRALGRKSGASWLKRLFGK